jgi:hypothetical protein
MKFEAKRKKNVSWKAMCHETGTNSTYNELAIGQWSWRTENK